MKSRKVFVVGAFIPNGGTYMAYHLGRILEQRFSYKFIAVSVGDETQNNSVFNYTNSYQSIPIHSLEKEVGADDILIANPSFSSFCFGLSINCTKIMYIQGFNTFPVIDGFFDHYVSVSSFVANFIQRTYKIETQVIPPFIDTSRESITGKSWEDRHPDRILVANKNNYSFSETLENAFMQLFSKKYPDYAVSFDRIPVGIPNTEMLQLLSNYRYLLSLTPLEGFGLIPLEAMWCKTLVVAFDACGGRDYFKPDENALVTAYPNLDILVDLLASSINNDKQSSLIAENAHNTASQYSLARFEENWINFFSKDVGLHEN